MSYIRAHGTSTKAANVLSNSSGATLTIPHNGTNKIYLLGLLIISGAALVLVDTNMTLSGTDLGTFDLPLTEGLSVNGPLFEDYTTLGDLYTADTMTDVVLTIPSVLGGAETSAVLFGAYV